MVYGKVVERLKGQSITSHITGRGKNVLADGAVLRGASAPSASRWPSRGRAGRRARRTIVRIPVALRWPSITARPLTRAMGRRAGKRKTEDPVEGELKAMERKQGLGIARGHARTVLEYFVLESQFFLFSETDCADGQQR